MRRITASVFLLAGLLTAEDYTTTAVTPAGSFTEGIEGPACDGKGNLYAVSFEREGTIGRATPDGKASLWAVVPNGGRVNGMRLDSSGMLVGADYVNHLVHRIDPATARFGENLTADWKGARFHQPNDVGITANDTIYFTDPDWKHEAGLGRLFRIDPKPRKTILIDEGLRGPNGVTLSPGDDLVYVGLSRGGGVLVYDRTPDGSLVNKRMFFEFAANGIPANGIPDGIRCDVRGRLFVTMVNLSRVLIISPEGKLVGTIRTLGSKPANITFCGQDGRTVYITEKEHGRVEKTRVLYRGER
jgi:sugar lactone lactonase YvrE